MTTLEQSLSSERDAIDARAIQRICAGDKTAVAELYGRYARTALSTAHKILQKRSDADDVVHDAFIVVVERAGQYRVERGSVVAWLVTTVHNLAIDRARKKVRRTRLNAELRHVGKLRRASFDWAADPETLSWSRYKREALHAALTALSPSHRVTLELAFFENLSYPEIARLENVPLGTVKSRANRAMDGLRAALDPSFALY